MADEIDPERLKQMLEQRGTKKFHFAPTGEQSRITFGSRAFFSTIHDDPEGETLSGSITVPATDHEVFRKSVWVPPEEDWQELPIHEAGFSGYIFLYNRTRVISQGKASLGKDEVKTLKDVERSALLVRIDKGRSFVLKPQMSFPLYPDSFDELSIEVCARGPLKIRCGLFVFPIKK